MDENILESPTFTNFSIESTMEQGNKELLSGLFEPDTATTKPDEVVTITETTTLAPPAKTTTETITVQSLADALTDDEPLDDTEPKATDKKVEDTKDDTDVNQFDVISKELVKHGVFELDEEEELDIKTPEAFLERFEKEKQKGAIKGIDNFISQFGEDYQKAFDAIYVKGVDPKEYFQTYNNIQSFADMDLTKENNQIAVVRQALENQGLEGEDVDAEVDRLKNYGDLETVAQRHHKVLIKKEATKLRDLEVAKEQELKNTQAIKQQYYNNVVQVLNEKVKSKDFDGIPVTPKIADQTQDYLVQDKYKTPTGELLTDFDKDILELKRPENHALKVKIGLLMQLLKEDPTLSTIQKKGVSKQSDKLFQDLARQTTKVKTNQPSSSAHWSQNL